MRMIRFFKLRIAELSIGPMKNYISFSLPLPTKNHGKMRWGSLSGAGLALALIQAATEHTAPILLLTPDNLTVHRLSEELHFFTHDSTLPLLTLPDWETLPYDHFSPHQDIVSQRLLTLTKLPTLTQGIIIASINTVMQRLCPVNFLTAFLFHFNMGDRFEREKMKTTLIEAGYRSVGQVMEHGEFTTRGSLFDLFPMGNEYPLRIDLFDDTIDSIRYFDPETQRSLEAMPQFSLLPAHEFPLDPPAITCFRQQWRQHFSGNPLSCPLYQDISAGLCPSGIEYYLPLFFEKTTTITEFLPKNTVIATLETVHEQAQSFWKDILERYEQLHYDVTRPILTPVQVFVPPQDIFGTFSTFPQLQLHTQAIETDNLPSLTIPDLLINPKADNPLDKLSHYLTSKTGRILFIAPSAGRRETLLELLEQIAIHPKVYPSWQEFLAHTERFGILVSSIENGLSLEKPDITLITEQLLFGERVTQQRRQRRTTDPEAIFRSLAELRVGDPVVHLEHGVGRYEGLQLLSHQGQETEFVTLRYAHQTTLYVPVTALHLISRYSGADPEHTPLHTLGNDQWEKAKRKAAQKIKDVAVELLDIYAKRQAQQGFRFSDPNTDYELFMQAFPFEETPDQEKAIRDVIADMTSNKPMDRLICGDVGFGKTEVAMRAAFIAIQDHKQVVVLVPTTLLAQQHYENFKDRFADWPVRIEAISRFRSAKEIDSIHAASAEGKIDILVGTHKLLQKDMFFDRLGLLIIDEEHRFGVQQKERLKALRAEVDILTLTATPIPRTLNMAVAGIRDLSIIATPPAKRLAIKTFIQRQEPPIIREAIIREILRGGQVYFVHNQVDTIEKTADELQQLVPEARVSVAHGQMRERELERIMSDFYHLRFNVLVCTTIIETGIDVPSANTIIIHRADRFGLAQLHQLRGRVGRSHRQAYAYLLTPPPSALTKDAEQRLAAIAELGDLGIGFSLATHDLEIRGAGDLLGESQSGELQSIGFSLYTELLERAVTSLKAGKTLNTDLFPSSTEVDLKIPALIPPDYIPDIHTRLVLYKRIASANTALDLKELQVEMIDRFGLLPDVTKNLFTSTEIKLQAKNLGLRKLEVGPEGGTLVFTETPHINPSALVALIQSAPRRYQLEGTKRLRFLADLDTEEKRFKGIRDLLSQLALSE